MGGVKQQTRYTLVGPDDGQQKDKTCHNSNAFSGK